jgi:predicted O-linked N-acetylglucosamine transferase (SPINDLY family)
MNRKQRRMQKAGGSAPVPPAMPAWAHATAAEAFRLHQAGQLAEAEHLYRQVLTAVPRHADCLHLFGILADQTGRSELAARQIALAIAANSTYAPFHLSMAVVLTRLGRLDEAMEACRGAIALKPDYADAYLNLGSVQTTLGRLDEAEASYRRAIAFNPGHATAHSNLGMTLNTRGRLDEAIASFREALRLQPDHVEAWSNLLLCLNFASVSRSEALEAARRFGGMVTAKATPFGAWRCPEAPERLRVGFVSGDLRAHPVGLFLEAVLQRLAKRRLDLVAYPTSAVADAVTARLRSHFSAWTPLLGLTDEAAAHRIHADGIHVLVDLAGHTGLNRLPIFAWRPAPVQISWLGYFATTGLDSIDYVVTDPVLAPAGEEAWFTEALWRLPDCRWCFTPPDPSPEVTPLPAAAGGTVTFGCFNNMTKINDAVVALWARVLLAVPGTRLLLKSVQFANADECVRMRGRFAACGVGGETLQLEGPSAYTDYLDAYRRVDIALDPFPFTGGTTSVEGLWMGVPVLTLRGDSMVARQGESIAVAAGLTEWIAATTDEYVTKAAAFAGDLRYLAELRRGLRSRLVASPLFDADRFACSLEKALWAMWEQRNLPSGERVSTLSV